MTVATDLNRKTFTGDAVTTSFSTGLVVFFATSELTVSVVTTSTGVATTLTENTHYTVSGGSGANGTVNLAAGSSPYGAPSALQTLVIVRNEPITQETDFVNNEATDAEVAEDALDKLTMIAQQINAKVNRSFTLADTDVTGASTTLPTPAATTLLGWSGTGLALQNYSTSGLSTALTTAYTLTLLDDADAATARATLGFAASGGIVATGDLASGAVTALKTADTTVGFPENVGFTFAVASSALTITLCGADGTALSATNVAKIPFRSSTVATGTNVVRSLTANQTVTLSSGSTFGATNSTPFRGWIVEFDDAGTPRLGVINCLSTAAGAGAGRDVTSIYPLGQFGIASSTAEGGAGAADSAQVFYTGVAVASKAYSVLGYFTYEPSGLATVGTWSAVPTRSQVFGQGVPLPGQVVQTQRNDTGAVASGNTQLPFDDTIPQITEGQQVLSQAITPSSAANVLNIGGHIGVCASSALGTISASIFQDATANALATRCIFINATTVDAPVNIGVQKSILAGTTSATTLRVRAGVAAVATFTFNGITAIREMGASANSYLEVTEVMA